MNFKEYLKNHININESNEISTVDPDKFADIPNINEADEDLKKLVDSGKAFWITTAGGHHACIDKNGKLLSGMYKGKLLSDIASH